MRSRLRSTYFRKGTLMNVLVRTAACATFALGLAVSGAALAQSAGSQKAPSNSQLQIGNPDPTRSMDALLEAVRELRQASVLMLNKKEAAEREKAVDAALEAIADAQRAMMLLPRAYRMTKGEMREATDWPVVAARLDTATQELDSAIKALKGAKEGGDRDKAIEAMRDSLEKAQAAIAALPDRTIGK